MTTVDRRPRFPTAALIADCVGLGGFLAISLFAWLWSREVNLLLALWLSLNVFCLGWLLVVGAWWIAWSANHLSQHR